MAAPGTRGKEILITNGPTWRLESKGVCYAVTAVYTGEVEVCRNQRTDGDCFVGAGKAVTLYSFERTGEITELSESQYAELRLYGVAATYDPTIPTPWPTKTPTPAPGLSPTKAGP